MSKSLLLALALVFLAGVHATWVDLYSFPFVDGPSIMLDIACVDESHCYIAGGDTNTLAGIYMINGQPNGNFTQANVTEPPLIFMCIAMDGTPEKPVGVAAGLGLLESSMHVATSPNTFSPSIDFAFIGTAQNARINAQGDVLVMGIGGDKEVAYSSDGGYVFKNIKIPLKVPNEGRARYGAIATSNMWYIAFGSWPEDPEPTDDVRGQYVKINRRYSLDKVNKKFVKRSTAGLGNKTGGYCAAVAKTEDGGQTWKLIFSDNSTYYFNDIDCLDEKHCVVVAEGFDTDPGVRILMTEDGQTWKTVFQLQDTNQYAYSFVAARYISSTELWVGGSREAFISSAVFYHSTDGGKTWTLDSKLADVADVMGMEFIGKTGYATGVTIDDRSTVLKYDPNSQH